jgi:hypothetical protein
MKLLTLGFALAVCAWAGTVSHGPRELGEVVLQEVVVKNEQLIIRVDSGGCTDKSAIKANIRKEEGLTDRSPHYVVTFERVRVDDCKALLLDGALLEYDLPGELGISGLYTLAVTNRVFPRTSDSIAHENALKRQLVSATKSAIGMELSGYEYKLKVAQGGTGPAGNVERFKSRIVELKEQLETYQKGNPFDYPVSTVPDEGPADLFGEAGYGPVKPAQRQTVTVEVTEPLKEGALLQVEGTSKSGPFYHLAGIAENVQERLQPGRKYQVTIYLVYRREYVGLLLDHYVYITEVK